MCWLYFRSVGKNRWNSSAKIFRFTIWKFEKAAEKNFDSKHTERENAAAKKQKTERRAKTLTKFRNVFMNGRKHKEKTYMEAWLWWKTRRKSTLQPFSLSLERQGRHISLLFIFTSLGWTDGTRRFHPESAEQERWKSDARERQAASISVQKESQSLNCNIVKQKLQITFSWLLQQPKKKCAAMDHETLLLSWLASRRRNVFFFIFARSAQTNRTKKVNEFFIINSYCVSLQLMQFISRADKLRFAS